MTSTDVDENIPDNETTNKTQLNKNVKYRLYVALGLSAWGDRMWNFAVGIYFISLNPTNLLGVAINGIALNLAVILLGAAIGDWIDRNPRKPALQKALFIQNVSVSIMAMLVVFALYSHSYLSAHWMIIIQGLLIFIGIIATLASTACKVSISRDWVVALFGYDQRILADTNATIRRIDLVTAVLAPVLTGGIMAFTSRWLSAVIIAIWNIVSLVLELFLYGNVYKSAENILANKITNTNSLEITKKKKNNVWKKLFASVRGLKTYFSLTICLPGLSLALLYMTVLSFDSVTRAYVIEQGLSEIVLGLLNGLGAILGIIGTLFYQIFVKRVGLVRTGVIGFWSEFAMLSFCLLSLFAHGTSFAPLQRYSIGSCHRYENLNSQTTGIDSSTPFYCSNKKISVLLLVIGITLNRFGLWIADLSVNQLQQERVPEGIRGRIGGTQHSLNEFFDMLRYILIIFLPEMSQFGYHVALSVLSVFTASLIYTIWSCSSSSQLVPPATDIEMGEIDNDLDKHSDIQDDQKRADYETNDIKA